MVQFELWYAYYDSLFLKPAPTLSQQFALSHTLIQADWLQDICPPLITCFRALEDFIKDPSIWKLCLFEEDQFKVLQKNLNFLLYFLQVERLYSSEFWAEDHRRVEASLTHFYALLQMLLRSVLPYPTINLFECRSTHKLCINLQRLEQLFNVFFQNIQQMVVFFDCQKFSQEVKLIQNFFQNLVVFLREAPKIRRNQLNHVHPLTNFVVLTNPIEIMRQFQADHPPNRKKSKTLGSKPQSQCHFTVSLFVKQKCKSSFLGQRNRRNSESKVEIYNASFHSYESEKGLPQMFRLPQSYRNRVERQSRKCRKSSWCSLASLTTKISEIRSRSRQHVTSISKNSQKGVKKTISMRFRTTQAIQKSTKPKSSSIQCLHLNGQFQEQRFELTKSERLGYTAGRDSQIKEISYTSKMQQKVLQYYGGKKSKGVGRGWKILRQIFWERVRMRKMRKLLEFEQSSGDTPKAVRILQRMRRNDFTVLI